MPFVVIDDPLPELTEEDWAHVRAARLLRGGEHTPLLGKLASIPGALSCDLFVAEVDGIGVEGWMEVDHLLQLVGLAGGIVVTRSEDVEVLCDDPAEDPEVVAQGWAEAYGIALVVVMSAQRITAVKADGRQWELTLGADSGRNGTGPSSTSIGAATRASESLLRHYITNPQDIDALLVAAASELDIPSGVPAD